METANSAGAAMSRAAARRRWIGGGLVAVAVTTALSAAALVSSAWMAAGEARLSAAAIAAFENAAAQLRRFDAEIPLAAMAAASGEGGRWRERYEDLAAARADLFAQLVADGGTEARRAAAAGAADAAGVAALERAAMAPGTTEGVSRLAAERYVSLRARMTDHVEAAVAASRLHLTRAHTRDLRVLIGLSAAALAVSIGFGLAWREAFVGRRSGRAAADDLKAAPAFEPARLVAPRRRIQADGDRRAPPPLEDVEAGGGADAPAPPDGPLRTAPPDAADLIRRISQEAGQLRAGRALGLILIEPARDAGLADNAPPEDWAAVLAPQLAAAVRRSDMVARLGPRRVGLAVGYDGEVAVMAALAERALDCARSACGRGAAPVAGVATYACDGLGQPADGRDLAETLFRQAEIALERVGPEGADGFAFYAESDRKALERRRRIVSDVKTGLAMSSFHAAYRPVLACPGQAADGLKPGAPPVALDAALRWAHPTDGALAAEQFVSGAAAVGLLGAIERSALLQVLSDIETWRAAGAASPAVVVPILAERSLDADFVETLLDLAPPPGAVILELRRSNALADDDDASAWRIDRLREAGVGIGVDHATFLEAPSSVVSRLRPSHLRIGADLIGDVVAGRAAYDYVVGLRHFAKALGLSVFADGIDGPAHAQLAADLGCHGAIGDGAIGGGVIADGAGRALSAVEVAQLLGAPSAGRGVAAG